MAPWIECGCAGPLGRRVMVHLEFDGILVGRCSRDRLLFGRASRRKTWPEKLVDSGYQMAMKLSPRQCELSI